jgi:hypothetical protein
MGNNPLLSPAENAALTALRSNSAAHFSKLARVTDAAMERAPTLFPSLANIARNPWHEIVFTIALALAGGALVGGILIPVGYEVAQGKIDALPYALWGVSLWLACAGWLRGRKWLPFVWFTFIILVISSWV